MYQNVTGYFNTYYNVTKLYGEAVDEVRKTRLADQDTNYFAPYDVAVSTDTKFEKVIEKCSKLLQFYPKSDWVDNALLMIGKSYVYKGESESAIRKFGELFQNFPTSGLRFEAELWSAKAQYYNHKDEVALQVLNKLLSDVEANEEEDIILEAFMLQGHIYEERNEYTPAAESYEKAAQVDGNAYLRAIAQFLNGQNLERLGLYEKAAASYSSVENFKPDFGLSYRSRLRYGVMLSKMGHYEKALDAFVRLEEEELKPAEVGMIELEIANTYNDMGDTAKAFTVYAFIDTAYAKTEVSARSYYQRGLIHEKQFKNYALAQTLYNNAKTEYPLASITLFAKKKADNFEKYFKYHSTITASETLLYHALHPDTTKPAEIRAEHHSDSTRAKSGNAISGDSLNHSKDSLGVQSNDLAGEHRIDSTEIKSAAAVTIDSLAVTSNDLTIDSGKVFTKPPDLSEIEFDLIEKQKEAKTRRVANRRGRDDDEDTTDVSEDVMSQIADSAENGSESAVSRPVTAAVRGPRALSPDSLRMQLVRSEFELAGLFLLEFEIMDSAKYWYERTLSDNPNSIFTPRALYALAEIHRSLHDSVAVDSLYSIVLTRYEDTEYARQIKKLKGIESGEAKLDTAEVQYGLASDLLMDGRTDTALQEFLTLAKRYPSSPYAAKAQYTAGWIYENILVNNDSAVSCYRALMKDYPASVYANAVQAKVAVKDKPESLQQYVKVNEIQLLTKQVTAREEQVRGKKSGQERDSREGDSIQKGRGKDRGDEEIDEEEAEPVEPDDDDNN